MMHRSRPSSFVSIMSDLPLLAVPPSQVDVDAWINHWRGVPAQDLIDCRIVAVDKDTTVEEACEALLSEDILCLIIKSENPDDESSPYVGLFDYSDVNAFLTLAATRHTWSPEDLRDNPRVDRIVTAARAGRVSVSLVSNLSEKNPLRVLPHNANIISLLRVFCHGAHRVLIQSPPPSTEFLGMVSDRGLLAWFSSYAQETVALQQYLWNTLDQFSLPSLDICASVVASTSNNTVLAAMKLMSEQGVGSVAVLDEDTGLLLSAVSVTDIGKIVVPSQSNQILTMPLHQFIAKVKAPDGSTDGADKYPVYSVLPTSPLSYSIQKLLATNAHRLFVIRDAPGSPSVLPATCRSNLSGIVSIVDILSLFAQLAKIPDVDPTRMRRHRRASSSSSSSRPEDFNRSRPSSRTSTGQAPPKVIHRRSRDE